MKTKLLIFCIATLCLSVAPAMAATFGDGGAGLQGVLDGITVVPPSPGPGSSVNVLTDEIADGMDKHWHITATGGSLNTVIIELASFAPGNVFGVYDIANPANLIPIFGGAAVGGDQASLSIASDGEVLINFSSKGYFGSTWFGYYLDSSAYAAGGLFYSDTALNVADNMDHMYAYQGTNTDYVKIARLNPDGTPKLDINGNPTYWGTGLWTDNEYILAFEDLLNSPLGASDRDFTDFVVMVESVVVPVPAAVLLGMLGLSVAGIKLRRFA